jgi:hypothetical protein
MEFVKHTGDYEGSWHIRLGRLYIIRHSTHVVGHPFKPFVIEWWHKEFEA